MENLSQEMKVKQRDRWSCKRCGERFGDLSIVNFGVGGSTTDSDDNYITLCKICETWALAHVDEAVPLFQQLLRKNKVVLVGDCHGRFDVLDEVLRAEEPFDFFISVGDVGELKDVTPDNIHYIEAHNSKGFSVKGNHDDAKFFTQLELMQEIGGLKIAGLNGIIRNHTFARDTKDVSFREVLYLTHQKDVDILVTHQAPTGVFTGIGEPVLEELLNYLVPKIYIFGHVHKYRLKFHLQTFVISLPIITKGHAVAYFQGRELRNLEIIFKKGKKIIRV